MSAKQIVRLRARDPSHTRVSNGDSPLVREVELSNACFLAGWLVPEPRHWCILVCTVYVLYTV